MSVDYLESKNKHPRDANIKFKANGHIYTIKHAKCPEGDTGFTSVTTFVHTLFQKFDSEKIINNMMKSKNWSNSKYFGMTKAEIKKQWSDKGGAAADAGTKLHADIEEYYNEMSVENDSIEYEHFVKFRNDYSHLTAYRTEWMIYHEELKFAGSIDMVFQDEDGTLLIYDWKRVAEISKTSKYNQWSNSEILVVPDSKYWHYSLQLNVYKAILIEKYNMNVGDLYLVGLHPDNKTYNRILVKNLQDDVKQLFAQRVEELNS